MVYKIGCIIQHFYSIFQQANEELQRTLVLDDCYIPNYKLLLPNDLARTAVNSASSEKYPVVNLVNGELRNYGRQINCWQSDGIAREGEWIRLNWSKPQTINQKFDFAVRF